jgi:hypothetical protein
MGNNRTFMILGAIVVVLGVLYVLSSQRRPSLDESGGFVDLVEGTLSTDDVHGISILRGEDGFHLVNGDQGWVVEDHFQAPANLNKIRTLLGNLESVSGEFRSDEESVIDSYALADSSAYRLTVAGADDEPLVDLLVGKRSGSGCFVRRVGETRVYATDHNFLSDFGVWGDDRPAPQVSSWVDLVAFETDRDQVSQIRIEGDETVVLDREFVTPDSTASAAEEGEAVPAAPPAEDNYEWRVNSDFVGSRTRGDGVLSAVVSIRARDVLGRGDAPDGSGLDDPSRVVVTTSDGDESTLLFGGAVEDESGQVWFQVEGQDLLWAVPDYVRNNLFKTPDELRPE